MSAIVAAFVLTAGIVADATGGRVVSGSVDRAFASVATDSRAIPPDALFIALAGPRHDAHAFLASVIEQGAAGLLVSHAPAGAGDAAVIVVDDTLVALQRLARWVRRRSHVKVVAITGSAGKTTTKEVAAELLSARYDVFRNRGNLNNHIGLPLSLLELRHGPDVAIVELGMNHAGEIRTLVEIAEPDVRVWTNVGDAHIGFFASRDAIADAKAEILEGAGADGVLVANADDPLVMARVGRFAGRAITVGESAAAAIRASHVVDAGFDGTTATVDTPAGRFYARVSLAGRAQLSNVLAATAVAIQFEVPVSLIEARVSQLAPVSRRGAVTTLANGARLVDDSYNASPAATRAMLAALKATPTTGRRLAVLGEMLELGDAAQALHRVCGRDAASSSVDELVVIGGPAADGLTEGASEGGLPPARIHRFDTSEAAAGFVRGLIRANDLVLVKGSHGTRLDLVADHVKAEG